MKRLLLLTTLTFATPAYAWDAQTAGAGPQAIGQDGGSAASAGAVATGGRATATGGAARSVATGGAGGRGGNAKGGSSNVSVSNTVGSGGGGGYSGGLALTNPGGYGNAPCGGGVGLGGLGLSGGGSGGGTLWEFGDCKRMRESEALRELGYPDAALAELCQIGRVRDAFGGRCPTRDVVAVMAPAPEKYRYDFCYTASAGELRQHKECYSGKR